MKIRLQMEDEAYILKTDRLGVRHWKESDFDDIFEAMSNELTHKHTGEEAWREQQTKEIIHWNIENTNVESGYFNLPLVLLETGKVIGRVGLNPYIEEERMPEIEWTINPKYWNRGYATEIAEEMLRFAFEEAGFGEVIGIVKKTNLGSIRVLEKVGAEFKETKEFRGEMWDFYGIEK